MRDILISVIVFGSLPFILKRPYIGILMWVWISVMNPHRLAYGFAYSFPFAEIIALTTLLSTLFSKARRFPVVPTTVFLMLFMIWMNITSLFAIHFDQIYFHWATIMKILLMTLVSIAVIHTREQVRLFIWVLVLSLGFYGVKGGIFTLASGGNFHVWGPEGSFIEDNNSLALALIMLIPLMRYLQLTEPSVWVRRGLTVAMLLCGFSALGSYSRGALIAIAATSVFLWFKSPRKLVLGVGLTIAITLLVTFMPAQWEERMHTIDTYQQDASAMGRINAWHMAWNLAMDRPIVGGGFEIYDKGVFAKYAPNPLDVHAAHSIYFQVLGEHGFVGLALFLILGILTWRNGSWIIAKSRDRPDLLWASDLAKMLQVSQIAYATGGAFLSLAYFDMPYYVLAAMLITRIVVERELHTVTRTAAILAPKRILKNRPAFSRNPIRPLDQSGN